MPKPFVRVYIAIFRKAKKTTLEFQYQEFAAQKKSLTVLQVGANDGLINDPLVDLIFKFKVKGILIEPQVFVFNKFLKPLHQHNTDLNLVNAAIAPQKGTQTLYTISFSNKRWATGLASFEKKSLEESIRTGYVEKSARKFNDTLPSDKTTWIRSVEIQAIDFNSLLKNFNIQHIDILQIDAEGYDIEILKMFPFDKVKPSLIGFETDRSSTHELTSIKLKLEQLGYVIEMVSRDALARLVK